jgi:hypothetical protein
MKISSQRRKDAEFFWKQLSQKSNFSQILLNLQQA